LLQASQIKSTIKKVNGVLNIDDPKFEKWLNNRIEVNKIVRKDNDLEGYLRYIERINNGDLDLWGEYIMYQNTTTIWVSSSECTSNSETVKISGISTKDDYFNNESTIQYYKKNNLNMERMKEYWDYIDSMDSKKKEKIVDHSREMRLKEYLSLNEVTEQDTNKFLNIQSSNNSQLMKQLVFPCYDNYVDKLPNLGVPGCSVCLRTGLLGYLKKFNQHLQSHVNYDVGVGCCDKQQLNQLSFYLVCQNCNTTFGPQ